MSEETFCQVNGSRYINPYPWLFDKNFLIPYESDKQDEIKLQRLRRLSV